jgi:probable rRNA maturation factor
MILIEPAIEEKFGRASLKKQEMKTFLAQAIRAAELSGTVSVLLTGDEEIRRLNREFRHKDKATDVLSFPAAPFPSGGRAKPPAGDLAISAETAAREAATRGHSLLLEIKVLLLHGVLHLSGYDHETDSGEMAEREEILRSELGLTHGLIARTVAESKTASSKSKARVAAPRRSRSKKR